MKIIVIGGTGLIGKNFVARRTLLAALPHHQR